MKRSAAFTLLELVIVMILVAIVSIYAASRYLGVSSFSPFAAQQQAISVIRQLQIYRMQSNGALNSDPQFQLVISHNCLGSKAGCDALLLDPDTANARSDVLWLEDLTVTATSGVVEFDLLGNPLNSDGSPINQVQVQFSSSSETQAICINAIGYASAGACS